MRVVRAAAVAAAFLVVSVGPMGGSALAQPGRMGGFGEMFDAAISTRDLERYARFLSLTPEQREAASALLEGFQAEFDRLARRMREATDAARDEFRDTRDMSVWEDMRPMFEEFRAAREKIEGALMADIRTLLTDDQAALWPRLERMRRRDLTLRRGFISGEGVDIVRMVEDASLPPEVMQNLAPVLEQYEIEVDRALVERNELYEQGMQRGMELWRTGDMAAMTELFNKAREAAVKVRDANRRFARQVEGLLPEGAREDFSRRFREASFPGVYRETYADRALALAADFTDLSAEQREALVALRESHARQAARLGQRWAEAQEESEMTTTPMMLMGGGGSAAVREARRARREADDQTLARLGSILTEEQRSRLPDRRGRDTSGAWERD